MGLQGLKGVMDTTTTTTSQGGIIHQMIIISRTLTVLFSKASVMSLTDQRLSFACKNSLNPSKIVTALDCVKWTDYQRRSSKEMTALFRLHTNQAGTTISRAKLASPLTCLLCCEDRDKCGTGPHS